MRNWNNTLFMDAMPGRYEPLDKWINEVTENRIDVVVCLASEAEIGKKSPDYADLRRSAQSRDDHLILPVGDREPVLKDFPIKDFSVPAEEDIDRFWLLTAEIAHRLEEGFRVFVHCGAGIGRTGTFAIAVLMMMGKSVQEATQEIALVDSGPETDDQKLLLEGGLPSSLSTPPDIDKDPIAFSTWMNSYSDVIEYQSCSEMRSLSPLTQKYGLRTIIDPSSDGWANSSRNQKIEALSALCLISDNENDPASAFRAARTQVQITFLTYPDNWIRKEQSFLAASLLFQTAVDPDFNFPNDEDSVADWIEKQNQMGSRKTASTTHAPDLGRYVFDSMGSEGESITPQEKISRLRAAIEEGYSVLELVTVYLDRFGDRKELRTQALEDLFALAAIAHLLEKKGIK